MGMKTTKAKRFLRCIMKNKKNKGKSSLNLIPNTRHKNQNNMKYEKKEVQNIIYFDNI